MRALLEQLRIRGLGVIDEVVLPLGPGLTVVTGETGAGKTMVVTGLLLLFGGRADAARVRAGADRASVDGRLELAPGSPAGRRVEDAGGELDDGTGLVLRRTVSALGRSRAYVGGAPAPVSVLGELADTLVAVHGQADQLRLTRPGEQRATLDRFASVDLDAYAAAYDEWRTTAAQLADRTSREAELRREADLLGFGLSEIEAAAPQPGEDAELSVAAARLAHADALRLASRTAHDALLGNAEMTEPAAVDVATALGAAQRLLAQQAGADAELDALASRLVDLAGLAADLGAEFGAYADTLDADPARLEQIEARRAVLAALVRKYADGPEPGIDEVLGWAKRAATRLAEIDVSDDALAELARRRDLAAARACAEAAAISARRRSAAEQLGTAVTAELAGLAMPTARLRIAVRPRTTGSGHPVSTDGGETVLGADGADEVEFLFQPRPDAPALPLGRGASGGELSRVMLAVEVCLAGSDPVPTMVFDEVDAGVGGRAAVEIGRRLARLARDRQVVVVTHLAQVAAYADRHVVVDAGSDGAAEASATGAGSTAGAAGAGEGETGSTAGGASDGGAGSTGGVTRSDVRTVVGEERAAELARMLAGTESGAALDHARELLAAAATDRGS